MGDFWTARFASFLLDHLKLENGLKVLDIGCGSGSPSFELVFFLDTSSKIFGVDISEKDIDQAIKHANHISQKNISFEVMDASKLSFENNSFDLVVSNVGVNNFKDKVSVFKECFRVLEDGGRLALTTNPKGHMREFYELLRESVIELDLEKLLPSVVIEESHRVTREYLRKILDDIGFSDFRIIEDEFQLKFVNGDAFINSHFIAVSFLEGWKRALGEYYEIVFENIKEKINVLSKGGNLFIVSVPMLYFEAKK